MAKPIIKNINCFDATKDYEVEIIWTGNRSYSNKIVIYDNRTNEKVFEETQTTFSLKHKIPANTLTNGINKTWIIQAQVFDKEGTASVLSDKVLFHTFNTPQFFFRDGNNHLADGYKVNDSSYQGIIYYQSDDLEDLESYRFYLYDVEKKLLITSERLNDRQNITYQFRGLENNTEYYIQCIGTTKNGMSLDTGIVRIYVRYTNPSQYSRIFADTLPNRGCVQVGSNIIIIQYNGEEIFEYTDGMINLIDKTLVYDEGFMIADDFSLQISGYHLWQTAEIFKFSNDNFDFSLTSRIYSDGTLRFRILVPNGLSHYVIYSEPLKFTNVDLITILVKRVNNVYGIYVKNNGYYDADGDYWFGAQEPIGTKQRDIWLTTDDMDTYKVSQTDLTIFYMNEKPSTAKKDDIWLGNYKDEEGDYWFGANKPYESKSSDVWLTEETGETYMVAKENRIIVVQDEKPTDLKKDDIWL